MLITGPHACCVLAAKAMSVGANISEAQIDYLRTVYKRCGLHKEGIEQMAHALDNYKSGTSYQLIEPDRTDHNIQMAFDDARCKALGGISMANYRGPRYFKENVPEPDFQDSMMRAVLKNMGRDPANEPAYFPGAPVLRKCVACRKLPEQVLNGLKLCGHCKKVMYCGRECQAENWHVHKKHCKLFAQMPPPPAIDTLRSSPMCVPGFDPLAAGAAQQANRTNKKN
jgi:hypothetical protein